MKIKTFKIFESESESYYKEIDEDYLVGRVDSNFTEGLEYFLNIHLNN
jgi:hypothetical protein